jgi:hypothetical protein
MKTELELLGAKRLRAVTLRRGGMTYREIGEKIGVSPGSAMQIVGRGEAMLWRRGEGIDEVELSVRAVNCLNNAGIGSSRKSVREAIDSGVLHPSKSIRNYGWETHKICCEYAGTPCSTMLERLRAEVVRLEERIEAITQSGKEEL